MTSNIVKVQITNDYMNKIKRAQPDKAICEMIWNALDADSKIVTVTFPSSGLLPGDKKIVITDNGTGINWGKKELLFGNLGASWKKNTHTTLLGRKLHGSEGHGRFKGYALGRVMNWTSTYKDKSDDTFSFKISGKADNPTDFEFDEHNKKSSPTGVTVVVDELFKQFEFLEDPTKLIQKIAPVFSLYLKNHSDINLTINGTRIDPSLYIADEIDIELDDIEYEGSKYPLSLKIVEWAAEIGSHKEVWLCSKDEVPLQEYDKQIRSIGDYSYTAYLSSDLFRVLNHQNLLSLSGLSNDVNRNIEEAIKTLKEHFKQRKLEDHKTIFEDWRSAGIYPYSADEILKTHEGLAPVEKAEQELFDILAITVTESLPGFNDEAPKTKKFQLHMLRQAIESGDTTLKRIFKEVLDLPENQQKELAQLLEESSLSNMIKTSKEVSDRIKFITALKELIYDKDIAKHIKERSQLHKILADNTWIFGEQFTLTVNDQSLTKVLEGHLKSRNITDVVIDKPVKRIDGTNGIVDLMLTRSLGNSKPDEISYLVIELKRPTEHIGQKQYRQVEDYQIAIVNDPRFKTVKSTWEFWIIGDDYASDNFVRSKLKNDSSGLIEQNTVGNMSYKIKAVTWSMLFAQASHRLDFLKKHLDINASQEDSLRFLKEKYAQYTESVQIDDLEEAS
ncbi:MAG: DNA mismatch repair protein [Gammaproteobacteria bacterium]|nr:DNA mismatch repair protein [Gammaproteobacteria bacterium]